MSVYHDILTSVQAGIIADVDLTATGNVPAISTAAVVLRFRAFGTDRKEWCKNERIPGVIISPGRAIRVPANEGTNCTDDVHYLVHLQIVDHDESRYNANRMASWTDWMERIRKYFHESNLKNNVFATAGYVNEVRVPELDPLDERLFSVHDRCVMAMVLDVVAREPRDAAGSV